MGVYDMIIQFCPFLPQMDENKIRSGGKEKWSKYFSTRTVAGSQSTER